MDLKFETNAADVLSAEAPVLIGSFPTTTATNFVFSDSRLFFSDYVYADGNLSSTKEQDEAWENRGTTALVYDETYERHWDTWFVLYFVPSVATGSLSKITIRSGPKTASLFSVQLQRGDGKWSMATEFDNLLKGTGHVRALIIIICFYAQCLA